MPTMLRLPGKGKQVAYAILGKPANMVSKTIKKPKKQLVTTPLPH